MATCPDCEFDEIDLDDYEEGDSFSCPECGRMLVVNGDDVEIADEDDDLDDDDDEDEDEEEEDADGEDGDDYDELIDEDEDADE